MIEARLRHRFRGGRDHAPFTLDVDFAAAAGVTALFGPSGAGKTLVLDCIAGFVAPGEGRIVLDGRTLFDRAQRVNLKPRLRGCAYVQQVEALFPHMTLRANLAFASAETQRAEELLERMRLAAVAGRKPGQLSGGQRQRGAIARALMVRPKLLLLDEPARGLDAPLRAELYQTIRQVQSEFATPILLVTHDLGECLELASEMLILREGRLIRRGAPREVCDDPGTREVAELLGVFAIVDGAAVMPSRVRLADAPGPHTSSQTLVRVVDLAAGVRLEFRSGLAAETTRAEYERRRHNESWLVELPPDSIRPLR